MKITEDVRKYAAEQGMSDDQALQAGMEQKSREFSQAGAEIYGKATSGVIKDTVVVPTYGRASVDFTADQPGPALFHCHIQQHMDFGFKALLRYS